MFLITELENWAHARLPGDILTLAKQVEVVRALMRHFLRQLAGEHWERAETTFSRGPMHAAALRAAMRTNRQEDRMADAIANQVEPLARVSCLERVDHFASLCWKHLDLRSAKHGPWDPRLGQHRRGPQSVYWMCELALRLASCPAEVRRWAAADLLAGIANLFEVPSVIRAARFLSVGVDLCFPPPPISARNLLAGWSW